MMSHQETLQPIQIACRDFVAAIQSLSDEQFLTPIYEWAPRDIVAHLVGWNTLMIESSQSILAGKPPAYYEDTPFNYSHINAGYTAKFSSTSKQELLAQLKSSMESLEAFILSLPEEELDADHGVTHYSSVPATVRKIIASLAWDYEYHTQQIREGVRGDA